MGSSFLASLTDQSWRKALKPELEKQYFKELMKFIEDQRKEVEVFPSQENVFNCLNQCPVDKVKVVILGQDPYHGHGEADGLCFSVQEGVANPRSLLNIFKELQSEYQDFKIPEHGSLTRWAKQGVLLLNNVLTVAADKPNSHKGRGWEKFTDAIIQYLNETLENIVFMLWGAFAQKKAISINSRKHLLLKSAHPSPFSVKGFLGCNHFINANEFLKSKGLSSIDWKRL